LLSAYSISLSFFGLGLVSVIGCVGGDCSIYLVVWLKLKVDGGSSGLYCNYKYGVLSLWHTMYLGMMDLTGWLLVYRFLSCYTVSNILCIC
jgi:hypothetical protein